MKAPIQSVEVGYLVHATEDQARIQKGAEWVLGQPADPELESLEGHFGNEIIRARIHLTGQAAWDAFHSILSRMDERLVQDIAMDVESYMDEHHSMILSFDKQALVGGSLVPGSRDAVKVKIKPRAYMVRGGAPSFFQGLLREGRHA